MFSKKELQKLAIDLFNIKVIKSGTPRTPIYIDLKQLISHPRLLAHVSTMLWLLTDPKEKYDKICGVPFNASSRCGVPYTAITYAFQISILTSIPMLMRRQEPNSNNAIEGQFEEGDIVAIVEDEITNGSNILDVAVDLLKMKLKIGEALVVVDWEQNGRENLENAGIKVKSLFKITELIGYLREAGMIPVHDRAMRNHINVIECSKKIPKYTHRRINIRNRVFL